MKGSVQLGWQHPVCIDVWQPIARLRSSVIGLLKYFFALDLIRTLSSTQISYLEKILF
jgi:hypothetical protein